MKTFSKSKIMGVITLVTVICLNYAHAIDNYGVLENNLHWKILGQTSSSGDGSGGSSGGDKPKECPPYSGCQVGGCGASSCELEVSGPLGTEKVKVEATAGYFACCYQEWGRCYGRTYSHSSCCLW